MKMCSGERYRVILASIQTHHEKVTNKQNWHEDYDEHIVKEGKPFPHSVMEASAVLLETKKLQLVPDSLISLCLTLTRVEHFKFHKLSFRLSHRKSPEIFEQK